MAWILHGKQFADSEDFTIAEINCEEEGHLEWCQETFGLTGYPTLLFGDPGRGGAFLQEYTGERDYLSLKGFADTLFSQPLCNVDHIDGCDDVVKEKLERFLKMSLSEIEALEEKLEAEIDTADETYEGMSTSLRFCLSPESRRDGASILAYPVSLFGRFY